MGRGTYDWWWEWSNKLYFILSGLGSGARGPLYHLEIALRLRKFPRWPDWDTLREIPSHHNHRQFTPSNRISKVFYPRLLDLIKINGFLSSLANRSNGEGGAACPTDPIAFGQLAVQPNSYRLHAPSRIPAPFPVLAQIPPVTEINLMCSHLHFLVLVTFAT
jgi:hypothetical protein